MSGPRNGDKPGIVPALLPGSTGTVVVPPPGEGTGYWAGGPSVVEHDGVIWLAYRLRRPIGRGRGFANVLARSTDGVTFETVLALGSDEFGAESLERPALVRTPEGRWRLYVSCATPGTKHWRVDVLEADEPAGLRAADARTVLPGDDELAVKDPVIVWRAGRWHLWASCHPLERDADADRMVTRYATSTDGLVWEWHGTALAGRPGEWDRRGVRVSWVRFADAADGADSSVVAFYDGRATAEENYEELTGVAVGRPDALLAAGTAPVAVSPFGAGGFRYLTGLAVDDGYRMYYEAARADGAHELRTELVSDTALDGLVTAAGEPSAAQAGAA